MAQRQRLFDITPDEPIEGVQMSTVALSDEEILCRVREMVEGHLKSGGLTPIAMRPLRGYLSLVSHALLQPPRPPHSSPFPIPSCVFAVPVGDEGCASLPIARS